METRRFITKANTSQIQIDLPDSMVNKKTRKRHPPIELAGKVKELGNVMESAPLSDWGIE